MYSRNVPAAVGRDAKREDGHEAPRRVRRADVVADELPAGVGKPGVAGRNGVQPPWLRPRRASVARADDRHAERAGRRAARPRGANVHHDRDPPGDARIRRDSRQEAVEARPGHARERAPCRAVRGGREHDRVAVAPASETSSPPTPRAAGPTHRPRPSAVTERAAAAARLPSAARSASARRTSRRRPSSERRTFPPRPGRRSSAHRRAGSAATRLRLRGRRPTSR